MNNVRTLTVTNAATSYDLTVLKTVKRDLEITTRDDDEFLTDTIKRASSAISKYCNRVFALETVEETIRMAKCADKIRLSRFPIVDVTSVVEDDVTLDPDDADEPDFVAENEPGFLHRLSGDAPTVWSASKLVITYRAGYALITDLPDGIEDACLRLVKMAWLARKRDPLTKRVSIPGVIDQEFWVGGLGDGGALPPDVCSLLDNYRDITV